MYYIIFSYVDTGQALHTVVEGSGESFSYAHPSFYCRIDAEIKKMFSANL